MKYINREVVGERGGGERERARENKHLELVHNCVIDCVKKKSLVLSLHNKSSYWPVTEDKRPILRDSV